MLRFLQRFLKGLKTSLDEILAVLVFTLRFMLAARPLSVENERGNWAKSMMSIVFSGSLPSKNTPMFENMPTWP